MALFPDPFNPLLGLQEALETFRASGWLQSGPSGGGSYPPLNIFRKGGDLVLIAEVPSAAGRRPGWDGADARIRIAGRARRFVLVPIASTLFLKTQNRDAPRPFINPPNPRLRRGWQYAGSAGRSGGRAAVRSHDHSR